MDENIRREIIMEHYQNPQNKKDCKEESYIKVNTNNSSCIDNLDIYVKIEDEAIVKLIKIEDNRCLEESCEREGQLLVKVLVLNVLYH